MARAQLQGLVFDVGVDDEELLALLNALGHLRPEAIGRSYWKDFVRDNALQHIDTRQIRYSEVRRSLDAVMSGPTSTSEDLVREALRVFRLSLERSGARHGRSGVASDGRSACRRRAERLHGRPRRPHPAAVARRQRAPRPTKSSVCGLTRTSACPPARIRQLLAGASGRQSWNRSSRCHTVNGPHSRRTRRISRKSRRQRHPARPTLAASMESEYPMPKEGRSD